jgi:pilus assembly protein TadC
VYTDLTIDTRRTLIERFFPDYLHLVAANVRSGMSLDHALWGAVRPQFGVLSKEIELVSKKTMIGHPLDEALIEFSKKYDSQIVIRSISLIVEGIGAGSEIGDLLENIALNIEDITIRKQSMAANVTTYVIFVGFAVTVAAPLLFAIAIQLLRILHTIGEKVSISSSGTAFSLSTTAVGQGDFLFFCIANITCTAILASFIVSAIQSGRWTDAVKKIPVFLSVPLILFFVAQWILAYVFAGLI